MGVGNRTILVASRLSRSSVLGRRYRSSELSEVNRHSSIMEIIGASATASWIDSHDEDSTD